MASWLPSVSWNKQEEPGKKTLAQELEEFEAAYDAGVKRGAKPGVVLKSMRAKARDTAINLAMAGHHENGANVLDSDALADMAVNAMHMHVIDLNAELMGKHINWPARVAVFLGAATITASAFGVEASSVASFLGDMFRADWTTIPLAAGQVTVLSGLPLIFEKENSRWNARVLGAMAAAAVAFGAGQKIATQYVIPQFEQADIKLNRSGALEATKISSSLPLLIEEQKRLEQRLTDAELARTKAIEEASRRNQEAVSAINLQYSDARTKTFRLGQQAEAYRTTLATLNFTHGQIIDGIKADLNGKDGLSGVRGQIREATQALDTSKQTMSELRHDDIRVKIAEASTIAFVMALNFGAQLWMAGMGARLVSGDKKGKEDGKEKDRMGNELLAMFDTSKGKNGEIGRGDAMRRDKAQDFLYTVQALYVKALIVIGKQHGVEIDQEQARKMAASAFGDIPKIATKAADRFIAQEHPPSALVKLRNAAEKRAKKSKTLSVAGAAKEVVAANDAGNPKDPGSPLQENKPPELAS